MCLAVSAKQSRKWMNEHKRYGAVRMYKHLRTPTIYEPFFAPPMYSDHKIKLKYNVMNAHGYKKRIEQTRKYIENWKSSDGEYSVPYSWRNVDGGVIHVYTEKGHRAARQGMFSDDTMMLSIARKKKGYIQDIRRVVIPVWCNVEDFVATDNYGHHAGFTSIYFDEREIDMMLEFQELQVRDIFQKSMKQVPGKFKDKLPEWFEEIMNGSLQG